MKTIIILLAILNFEVINSQSLIHPAIPSDQITGLHYINDMEIILINGGGSIFKSNDGGNTWQLKKHYPNNYLAEVQFLDDQTGFIRTQNYNLITNRLIYTNDAGETWYDEDISVFPVISFLPVSEFILLKVSYDGIYRLDNFFNNWKITYTIPTYIDSGYDYISTEVFGSISKIMRLNNETILALGNNQNAFSEFNLDDSLSFLLKSENSGLTWDTLWIGLDQFIKDFVFTNDSIGWMISDTSLFKSTDGGINWVYQNISPNKFYYKSLYAVNSNIYLLDWYNHFIKTTNSGNTWTFSEFDFTWTEKMVFNDKDNGFVFGVGFYKTTNSGETWENLTPYSQNDIYDLHFISLQEGIAFGNLGVFKTYDGGNSWEQKLHLGKVVSNNPGKLEMLNDSIGFLLTFNYQIYKTTNSGESWQIYNFPYEDQSFSIIEFYNEKLGVVTSDEESNPGSHIYDLNNIFITTNGGENWIKKSLDSLYFTKLKFTDSDHLWGISQTGLYVSYDTASTWKKIFGGDYFIGSWSFDFYDSLFGVLTTSYDQAYLTSDGGLSWNTFSKPIGNHPTDCKILGTYIFGSQRILEVGSDGKILITYIYPNGEIDFSHQITSYTQKKLNKIEVFVENNFPYVWVAGDGFTIFYRQFEKIPTNIDEYKNNSFNFSLSQNYPNPFNPSTKIKYTIPQTSSPLPGGAWGGLVTLRIYDILGNEIATLVNEEKSSGEYEVEFDASKYNLSSGIYFYRLRAGTFNQTKKLILMK